jgi:hypothetical protein
MGDIGYRKKGDSGPLYNPERDYAYITPTLMRTAIENLDAPSTDFPADAAWRDEQNITAEELGLAVEALAKAQRDFVNAADPVSSLTQALLRHGFYDARPAVRTTLFAAIGEVICAAWFKAVREVSLVGEESPAADEMARFAAAAREFARRQHAPAYNPEYVAEALRLKNDVLQTRLNALYTEYTALQAKMAELAKPQAPPAPPKTQRTFLDYFTNSKKGS